MLLSLVYLILRAALRLLVRRSAQVHELEIVVLRHQLNILRRQVSRPSFKAGDRMLLAAARRALGKAGDSSFIVTPATLLRWHREIVKRKWRLYGRRRRLGRPPIAPKRSRPRRQVGDGEPALGLLADPWRVEKSSERLRQSRRSVTSCAAKDSGRLSAAAGRPGPSSSVHRLPALSLVTSLRWRRCF